ncbi:MAG: ExsB family transcriptional regulator, partial [Candidatus Hadarchaeaceae archaeon]
TLTAVFLDDGLMRKNEPQKVFEIFEKLGVSVKLCNVKDEFFGALKGLTDPEEKRKAFRENFYRVFGKVAHELGAEYLLQGTIAADVAETKAGVKTQHNVLEQIGIHPLEKYGFKILEPLKDLYKPEVREVAKALGLPAEIHDRRPFPGPGLSIRILGEVTPERVDLVRKATEIVEEETKDIPCFQAFAIAMGDRATGVTLSGERNYGEVIAIRVVQSKNAVTAKSVELPWQVLKRIEGRIREKIPTVTHVLYDLTDKPPATIEYE